MGREEEPIKSTRELVEERLAKVTPLSGPSGEGGPPAGAQRDGAGLVAGSTSADEAAADLAEIRKKAAERDEMRDQLLRARADLDNAQKRMRREMEQYRDYAAQAFVGEVLPALDDLERALAAAEKARDVEQLLAGVRMVGDQLEKALRTQGVVPIEAKPGDVFDPKLHEAVLVEERDDVPAGQVLEVLGRGHKVKDRLLRAAKVKVSRERAAG